MAGTSESRTSTCAGTRGGAAELRMSPHHATIPSTPTSARPIAFFHMPTPRQPLATGRGRSNGQGTMGDAALYEPMAAAAAWHASRSRARWALPSAWDSALSSTGSGVRTEQATPL